ncbi:D-isomer specific 2-hydroxyacid dehydrogenase NAD-binding [Anaeromyxobacter sp. K]|uniref:2-hydroxyacid dehydrogenase n=1 Tax=Anaeromyxobacter sp. (strain K) TaxID=447217 RepID=UPI00015F8A18|nr:D-glycerate dehydrogenase [Anaeromyxobacter sp. K]ACG73230.1 D-isomer specific 2-hydroxyacid dehydrogenase NAD-binding [Anaeromyxobacter sp. K]
MKPALVLARPLPLADLGPLAGRFELRGGDVALSRAELAAAVREAEVLVVTYLDRVDAALLEGAPRLRHVASYGIGVNHLDLGACRARGLCVTNTPDVVTAATADHAWALLLAAARRVAEGDRVIRAGGWTGVDPAWMLGTEVSGKTLGLVGFGRIGRAVAHRAAGFGMRVLYAAPRDAAVPGARRVDLDALLAASDFVSLHVPLTPATDGLMDRARLARMKPGAILVNTARGQVVDDAALAEALASGRLAAAGLDVFRDEPRIPEAFLRLPSVVLTPHLGSGTRETRAAMTRMVLDEVLRVAAGDAPRHPVP